MKKSKYNPRKKSPSRWLVYSLLVLLLAVGILAALEKTDVINLYSPNEDTTNTPTATEPEQKVDFTPATTTDNEDINQQKEDGSVGLPDQNDTSDDIAITINTRNSQSGNSKLVTTILSGTTSGSCTLELSKDSEVISKTASVVAEGTYYSCEVFSIPLSEFKASGTWKATVTVVNGAKQGSATTTMEVEL